MSKILFYTSSPIFPGLSQFPALNDWLIDWIIIFHRVSFLKRLSKTESYKSKQRKKGEVKLEESQIKHTLFENSIMILLVLIKNKIDWNLRLPWYIKDSKFCKPGWNRIWEASFTTRRITLTWLCHSGIQRSHDFRSFLEFAGRREPPSDA